MDGQKCAIYHHVISNEQCYVFLMSNIMYHIYTSYYLLLDLVLTFIIIDCTVQNGFFMSSESPWFTYMCYLLLHLSEDVRSVMTEDEKYFHTTDN